MWERDVKGWHSVGLRSSGRMEGMLRVCEEEDESEE